MSVLTRFTLATASILMIGVSAHAADLPSKKAPAAPIPVQKISNWTGVYGGLNAGLGFGSFTKEGKDVYGNPTGGTLGVTGGYNYQMPSNWVAGIEADFSLGNIKGSNTGSSEGRYLNTIRGRLGYAMNETMPYLTAGYAGATTHDSNGGSDVDNYHNGYTLGGGIEAVITGPWTAKAEALYIHLEEKDIPSSGGSSGADWGLVRVGLNYRF
ncbi:MAG: outer membrane beta-barrel protein [Alphaproteobacteria bacterium]